MQEIPKWIKEHKVRLLLGTLLIALEMFFFVFPVGLGYNYKKLLVLLGALTWVAIMVPIPKKLRLWLGIGVSAAMPYFLITWLEEMTAQTTFVAEAAHFYNIVMAYILELVLILFTLSFRVGIITTASFLTLLYSVNYFVYTYRGKAFSFQDIQAFQTVARVVGNYDLTPSNIMVVAWGFAILFVALAARTKLTLPPKVTRRNRMIIHLVGIGTSLVIAGGTHSVFRNMQFWEERNILTENGFFGLFHSNGLLVSTYMELVQGGVEIPEGYSPETAEHYLADYEQPEPSVDQPHVIMIMNESFADLRVWGNLQLNQECLPFMNSLQENTLRGYVNVSALGGGTANSEFEVLTGCTLGWLPHGYYPYQQCITASTPSMVSALGQKGYQSYSIHPENRTNWNRVNVYKDLGFDESLWMEDFSQEDFVHAGISDEAVYQRVIELYEAKAPGSKLFFHNVTMQNHGGYTWTDVEQTISATNVSNHELDVYLSLLKKSDEAFEMLVNYFANQEEKVIICMYGDHQPKLDEALTYDVVCAQTEGLSQLDKQMNLYKTPFVIWANYDIPEATGLDISLNYLGALTLHSGGITDDAYFNYLLDLMEDWPVITANGMFDSGRQYYPLSHTTDALEKYKVLQYYQLFGEK